MSSVMFLGLVLAALVGVPGGFLYWVRAPHGKLLRRTAVVGGLAAVWVVLFLLALQGAMVGVLDFLGVHGGMSGSDY